MNIYVGITDTEWQSKVRSRVGGIVNFWNPGGKNKFKALNRGELFLFKLHKQDGGKIVGGGFYDRTELMSVEDAWENFGDGNGVDSLEKFKEKVSEYRRRNGIRDRGLTIGCTILDKVFFFGDGQEMPPPEDWSNSIVSGKRYNSEDGDVGAELLANVKSHVDKDKLRDDLIFVKEVDKSLLYQGLTLPLGVVASMRNWFGDVAKGAAVPIKIELDGRLYDLKVNSVDFDERKYPRRCEVWQIRYNESSEFLQSLRQIFSSSYDYVRSATDSGGDIKIPKAQVEKIEFRRTDNPKVWTTIIHAKDNTMNINAKAMQAAFKKWLMEVGPKNHPIDTSAAVNYVGSVAAVSMPGPKKSSTGAWRGIFEYLVGVPPAKQIFEVSDLEEFDRVYGALTPYFATDEKVYGNYDRQRYDECYAHTHVSGAGDHQRMKNAYRAYRKFLGTLGTNLGLVRGKVGQNMDKYLAAIRTKPFILLAGISGTGKSRLVRQLARGCCPLSKAGGWSILYTTRGSRATLR